LIAPAKPRHTADRVPSSIICRAFWTESVQAATELGNEMRRLLGRLRPVRVLALNVEEGWVRDASQIIAAKVRDVARLDGQGLTGGTRGFIEAHSDPADQQQVLPLWL
jgi:hypothetical protein